jgi:hypothetical protein
MKLFSKNPIIRNQMNYNVDMTDIQWNLILDSLDLFVKLGLLKVEEIDKIFNPEPDDISISFLYDYKKLSLLSDPDESLDISDPKIHDSFREALTVYWKIENGEYGKSIIFSDSEIQVILESTDLFQRLGMRQIYEITRIYGHSNFDHILDKYKKHAFGLDYGAYYGIFSSKLETRFKELFDIIKTIQLRMVKDRKINNPGVWGNGNIQKVGKEPVISIKPI